jgi:AcrR family transcriptional regulator
MTASQAKAPRWSREDWIELGARSLRTNGPAGVTLEALCVAAARTRGSFYHHFAAVDELAVEIAALWRRTETEAIGAAALAESDPRKGLRTLARLSAQMDHALEIGVRALGAANPAVAAIVRDVDEVREGIIADLLARAYQLAPARAAQAARLFHSLQLAAQVRAPQDVAGFSDGPARLLTDWLEREGEASGDD